MNTQLADNPEISILVSGGIDSTACLHLLSETGRPCEALFIDYGQAAQSAEQRSVIQVANHYKVPLRSVHIEGVTRKADGAIPARNLMLVSVALMERLPSVTAIALGIHSGTEYPDCSQEFLTRLQLVTSLCQSTHVEIIAPFIAWLKTDILSYCADQGVPVHLTHSCELSDRPCGNCLSCRDRMLTNAGS